MLCEGLFDLAPGGVYLATNCCQSHGALLPHPFSLTCASSEEMRPSAVFSLLHLSWARAPQTLSGTLLYGARTFLPFTSLPKDFNISFPKDLNVSLPKDINKAAITRSTPRADCIEINVQCLARSQICCKPLSKCTNFTQFRHKKGATVSPSLLRTFSIQVSYSIKYKAHSSCLDALSPICIKRSFSSYRSRPSSPLLF